MKILHINIIGPSNEGMSYQGCILPLENKKAGHEVMVIWSCYKWNKDNIIKVDPEDVTRNGIRYIRISYDFIINEFISEKIRKSKKLLSYIEGFNPDVILNHDFESYELLTVAKYIDKNPNVKLYVDSHTDRHNSGTNWLSMNIMHKFFYKAIINSSLKYIQKLLCITTETMDFAAEVHKIPRDKMEFYPLGGTIVEENVKAEYRRLVRDELKISDETILLCHSGKMDGKKRTFELIQNFVKLTQPNISLILIGEFTDDVEKKVTSLIQSDSRIEFLGWKSSDDLIKYIAASDLYCQPGSQSATMQSALCAGTPVLVDNVKSYEPFMQGNMFAINKFEEMETIFNNIISQPQILINMSEKSYTLARKMLDYKKLAERITI